MSDAAQLSLVRRAAARAPSEPYYRPDQDALRLQRLMLHHRLKPQEVARSAGVNTNAVTRCLLGRHLDVESWLRLGGWMADNDPKGE